MLNKILFVILIFTTNTMFAQINTESPYSRFGIGDLDENTTGQSLGMGGVSIGMRSPANINLVNPASISSIMSQLYADSTVASQYFLFHVSLFNKMTDYLTENSQYTAYNFGIKSMNIAFRMNKFWSAGLGLTPYSSVGYNISDQDSITIGDNFINNENAYFGEGGLNKVYFNNAFNYKGVSLGIAASYIFGSISHFTESKYDDDDYVSFLSESRYLSIRDFNFRAGLQYTFDSLFNKNVSFSIGAFYESKTNLNAKYTRFTQRYIHMYDAVINDTLYNDTLGTGDIEVPQSYGIGIALRTKKIVAGIDYSIQDWTDAEILGNVDENLTKMSNIAAGIEFTDNLFSKNYFRKISYRLGGYMNNTYLNINGQQIKKQGITFGFGLPLRNTYININFDAGIRGTTENNLVKENYYIINLDFNMADLWFAKRKFN